MAKSALTAQADAATVNKLSEMIAQNNGGKK
jgi:hypothetical protein